MAIIRIKCVLLFLVCLANSIAGFGASVNDSLDPVRITGQQFLLDPNGEFTYIEILNKNFSASAEEAEELISKLNKNRSVWIKLNAENHSDQEFDGVIYSDVCSQRSYFWQENDSIIRKDVGFLLPDSDDVIFFDRFLVPVKLKPGEVKTYYIKCTEYVRYLTSGRLKTFIGKREIFDVIKDPIGSSKLVNLHVFFNGFLIFQLFYILLQWFLVRRIEYIYYALYIFTLFAYFWPRHVIFSISFPQATEILSHFVANFNDILLVLPAFFYLKFARHFLDMAFYNPSWNKRLIYFEYLFLFLTVLIIFTNALIPNDLPKNSLILGCVGIQFVLSLAALRGFFAVKTRLAQFAISAGVIVITAHLVATVISVFRLNASLDIAPIAITMVAIIIEIAIFNSGLLYKARQVEKDKVKAQTILIQELEARQKLQLEYEGVRDKISRDLHDDVGSTLSSVSIYSYAAKDKLEKGDLTKTKDLLFAIEKNALSTLNSMGDLVWAINPQNDSTEKLLERINTFGYSLLAVKDCKFEMEIDPEFYSHRINLEQRRSILLICKEALNNAAKYSGADDICLKIFRHNKKFRLELSDNGHGFNLNENECGNGLRSMEARAATMSDFFEITSNEKGTTIKFDID